MGRWYFEAHVVRLEMRPALPTRSVPVAGANACHSSHPEHITHSPLTLFGGLSVPPSSRSCSLPPPISNSTHCLSSSGTLLMPLPSTWHFLAQAALCSHWAMPPCPEESHCKVEKNADETPGCILVSSEEPEGRHRCRRCGNDQGESQLPGGGPSM